MLGTFSGLCSYRDVWTVVLLTNGDEGVESH